MPDPLARALAILLAAALQPVPLRAGEVEVVKARAHCQQRLCRFEVTLRHQDSGWAHYADRWQVLSPSGTVLATRRLLHPHVDEQPFTRSLSGVTIPPDIDHVLIGARDSRHGETAERLRVVLP